MKLSQGGLVQLLQNSVVEVRFKRRRPKPGYADWRRMLCTNSPKVLKSLPGRLSLHYVSPKGMGLDYNPKKYRLIPTWDIFWQDYRMISLDQYDIVSVIPVNTKEEELGWWAFFNEILREMSAQSKVGFMNR